MINRMINQ